VASETLHPPSFLASPRSLLVADNTSIARRLSKDRFEWVSVVKTASWSSRFAHSAALTSTQQMFVIAGSRSAAKATDISEFLNDVWLSSDNGNSWSMVIPRSDRFGPRRGHATTLGAAGVVMYVTGGFCGKDCFMNDWWSSENGAVWNAMGDAPWSGRHGHAVAVTSSDTLVLTGGHNGGAYMNDVWSIQDPSQAKVYSTWKPLDNAAWSPRYGHAVVVDSRDVILLMGGFYENKRLGIVRNFNDVWRSDDAGATWSLVTGNAPWMGRYQHTASINLDDEVFIVGGLSATLQRCNDVWRSKDTGMSWTAVTPSAPWAARYEHAAVMDRNGSIYVIGGVSTGAATYNDVWRSERTCEDDMECPTKETCRDGTFDNFAGQPNPRCVHRCERRIFDKCDTKQACQLQDAVPTCVDPCISKKCKDGYVCEVHPRADHDMEAVAEAYCLSCGDAKTKYACDKLRQCDWNGGEEICQMKCRVVSVADVCNGVTYCEWDKGKDTCISS